MVKNFKYHQLSLALFCLSACSVVLAQSNSDTSITKLETLVVTASGFQQNLKDAPATMSIITKEELDGKAYYDITDALRDIPGVSIEGGGSGSNGKGMGGFSISIRGMGSAYSLLLIDGKPQSNSGQVFYNGNGNSQETGWLPPLASIERIEVIRGPMSSLYGSQALGGVINIITKKVGNNFGGTISAQTILQENSKSGDSQLYNFYLTGPIIANKLGFSLDGNLTKRDEDKIQYGYMKNTRENINGKLNWVINNANNLSLEYGYFTQKSDGSLEGIGTDIDEREIEKETYGLTHEYSWNDFANTKTFITREKMNNKFQNGGTQYIQNMLNSKTVLPFENNNLTFGLEYKLEESDHGTRGKNLKKIDRWSGSLFVEDEYHVNDNFILTGGLRLNDDEKYGNELTPRVYGIYHLTNALTIKGGVSTGYVTPNLKQGDSGWVEGGFGGRTDGADIGNDDLKPEKSTSYELGLIYQPTDNLNLSVATYKTFFTDKIQKSTICDRRTSSTTGDTSCIYLGYDYEAIAQYNNADEAELQGIEISGNYDVNDQIKLNANYTFSESEITKGVNSGEPLNNYPKHMLNLGLDYQPTDSIKSWVKARYRGKTLEDGSSNIPAYTIIDSGINYDINQELALNFGIYNLADKKITYEKYNKILDGRKYAIGIRYNF